MNKTYVQEFTPNLNVLGMHAGGVICSFEKERWSIFPIHQKNVGALVFQNLLLSQNRSVLCLPFGRRSEKVRAERGRGSIKVAISWQSHSKKKRQEGVLSNLLHTIIFTLPKSKLHCVYYAHIVKKKCDMGTQ